MEAAYDRERKLFPILLDATRRGIRVDRRLLVHHEQVYSTCHEVAGLRLATLLGFGVWDLGSYEILADVFTIQAVTDGSTPPAIGQWRNITLILNPQVKHTNGHGGMKQAQRLHAYWRTSKMWKTMHQNDMPSICRTKGTRTGLSSAIQRSNIPTAIIHAHPLLPVLVPSSAFMRQYCLPGPVTSGSGSTFQKPRGTFWYLRLSRQSIPASTPGIGAIQQHHINVVCTKLTHNWLQYYLR
jgi:hypothetical protein